MARSRRVVTAVLITTAFTVLPLLPQTGQAPTEPQRATGRSRAVEIPFDKWILPNGLTVIVHEDHRASIVFVGIGFIMQRS